MDCLCGIQDGCHRNTGANASQKVGRPGSDFRPNSSRLEINPGGTFDVRFISHVHHNFSFPKRAFFWPAELLRQDIWTSLALASEVLAFRARETIMLIVSDCFLELLACVGDFERLSVSVSRKEAQMEGAMEDICCVPSC